ncbi:unnamed protein product [Didymodactylos carnosus]|uniref:Amino acid transporter n=1 Tax=Didymodactylos carnosus TaxID=1234261 RepID=A0A814SL41_9BILA|nr:unnamed protein product [Didymodactylos carnosus]CAF1149799.1 unnamed protein product [Didymodactylos carnosus]CAF3759941.1 unnamed protein product [Didymodactylos carnosus]CAF3913340.1 unnamed protein product [Didymodactylos carnosus]
MFGLRTILVCAKNRFSTIKTSWVGRVIHPLTLMMPIDQMHDENEKEVFKRTLNLFDLIAVGLGAIIGAGIFVLVGNAAADFAGPAVILSFVLAGFVALLAALSFAEMSTMVPLAGSSYSFTYATMGEFAAWLLGWDLILENVIAVALVSNGWALYVRTLFTDTLHVNVEESILKSWIGWNQTTESFNRTGFALNLPAAIIVLALTLLLVYDINGSVFVNNIIVIFKVVAILIFIFASIKFIKKENYEPFIPKNEGSSNKFGVSGMFRATTLAFFAYTGFDGITTVAQDTKKSSRNNLPIAILSSFGISAVLYIGFCLALIGVVPYDQLGVVSPVLMAAQKIGMNWLAITIHLAAIASLTSVALINIMVESKILYSMANDGLLPEFLALIYETRRTPYTATIFTGVISAIFASLLPIEFLSEISSIGTLFSYFLVHAGLFIMRWTKNKDVKHSFNFPSRTYVIPILGGIISILLMHTMSKWAKMRFGVWMAVGVIVYFLYGRKKSKLRNRKKKIETVTNIFDTTNANDSIVSKTETYPI